MPTASAPAVPGASAFGSELTRPSPTSRGLGRCVSFLFRRQSVHTADGPRAGAVRLRRFWAVALWGRRLFAVGRRRGPSSSRFVPLRRPKRAASALKMLDFLLYPLLLSFPAHRCLFSIAFCSCRFLTIGIRSSPQRRKHSEPPDFGVSRLSGCWAAGPEVRGGLPGGGAGWPRGGRGAPPPRREQIGC